MRKLFLFTVISVLFAAVNIWAGTTGKIAGFVTDSENGEPLAGVNITIEETHLGAATDLDGHFIILNIRPGKYSVKASFIGYRTVEAKNTVVNIDLTTKINFLLESEVEEGETIVVEAKRAIVVKDISNSQVSLSAEEIKALPIQNVNQALSQEAGIESGRDGLIIRGGSARQTLYLVNGFSSNDGRTDIPYTPKTLTNLQEVQMQTGGFSSEYGDLRSGLVNMVTKDGSSQKYTVNFIGSLKDIEYLGKSRKNYGPSIYDDYSYYNRPFLDPDVMWTGTGNGAWDGYMQKQYPTFEGWNAVSDATMQDNDPSNDLSPEGAKRLYEWQHRRQGDIVEPDYTIDASFGGPDPILNLFPSMRKYEARFFFTYYKEKEMFIFPLSRDNYSESQSQLKYTLNLSPSSKLMLNGLYGEVKSVCPYSWTTTPTGRLFTTQSEVADLLNSSNGSSVLYMPDYYSPGSIFRSMAGIKFTHTLSQSSFFETSLQFKKSKYHTFQSDVRDTSKTYEPIPGYFVDEAPYGYWGYSSSSVDGMSMGGWMNLGRDNSSNTSIDFDINYSSQLNASSLFKAGAKISYTNYDVNSSTYSPSMSTWTRSMIYEVNPYKISMYAQDKLEFEGFVANVGLRLDYTDANSKKYKLSDYSKYLASGFGNTIEDEIPTEDSKAQLYISPRLGVSHPISENSKMYFNYGHFYTNPISSYRFRMQRESSGMVSYLGDPDVEMEKTISYELGYEHNLFDIFLLKLAAYYKDVSNQPSWTLYRNINSSVNYYKMESRNYEDIRGFEVTLRKQTGRWISGFINYTYDVHTSGYFGLGRCYEDPTDQREYLNINPYQTKPRPQPFARANINFLTPSDFGPQWNGTGLLNDWSLSVLAYWREGSYYTYNPYDKPDILYNTQWRNYHNVDLRIGKTFSMKNFGLDYDLQFFIDINNVFDLKYFSFAGFVDSYDREDYLRSLNFSWEEGVEHGSDKIGDYRPAGTAYDPLELNPDNDTQIAARNKKRKDKKSYIDMPNLKAFTFLNPRNIFFGIKLNLAIPGFY